jgi:dTDP-4-amino-4,6-dideoxygalactose transaminase
MFPDVKLLQTENFCARELTLPLHPSMVASDVEIIAKTLGEAISTF